MYRMICMRTIRSIFQFMALHLVSEEWAQLSPILTKEYHRYVQEPAVMPPLFAQKLLICGEDHRFFSHVGFDLMAICRAIYRRITRGKLEGASTIEQQIVRVLTGQYERTIARKVREILLAVLVTRVVPKGDLPGIYLGVGYYGWRMNNFRQACRRLGLEARTMSLSEAAGLVARLKYPEPRLPSIRRSTQIARRVRHLLWLHNVYAQGSTYKNLCWQETHASV
jgi:membrane peptidoglycan carboxypeptidase